jgi:hypothetical protein
MIVSFKEEFIFNVTERPFHEDATQGKEAKETCLD